MNASLQRAAEGCLKQGGEGGSWIISCLTGRFVCGDRLGGLLKNRSLPRLFLFDFR